ncbi:MAG: hypothetical protein PHI85_03645 [Victivallaceae bacterium]|nr:hypothetical protein [Victivallaceae bacterium]
MVIKTLLSSFAVLMLTTVAAMDAATLKLQLPPEIHAVPGIETNLYFDNAVLAVAPDNYVFDVSCVKGRNDAKRWRFTASAEDVGVYPLELKVFDDNGEIDSAVTTLIVSPRDSGSGRDITLLLIGDSLTDASLYPAKIYKNFAAPDNPKLTMIGTNGPGGTPTGGIAHEGYGGWTWDTFLTKEIPTPLHDMQTDAPPYFRPSPFLINGTFDFAGYLRLHNGGRPPDFIVIMLGINNILTAQDDTIAQTVRKLLDNADKMLAGLRSAAPDAIIGVGLVTPGAKSQDAFGSNYACGLTRWQFKKNQHFLNSEMIRKFSVGPDKKLFLIPTNLNLDCENNFPAAEEPVCAGSRTQTLRQRNGVHPSGDGYDQIGNTIYSWMKYHLAE